MTIVYIYIYYIHIVWRNVYPCMVFSISITFNCYMITKLVQKHGFIFHWLWVMNQYRIFVDQIFLICKKPERRELHLRFAWDILLFCLLTIYFMFRLQQQLQFFFWILWGHIQICQWKKHSRSIWKLIKICNAPCRAL